MFLISLIIATLCSLTVQDGSKKDSFRPKYHITSRQGRDSYPDGLNYYKGTYYFYHQVYYNSTLLKETYWAHLESKDLINWIEYVDNPAIYPTKQGFPFSGGLVIDKKNDAGFQKNQNGPPAFVAMFTRHNGPVNEEPCGCDSQQLWYSLDKGYTFNPYKNNPVIKRPHAKDFGTFLDPYPRRYKNKWLTPIARNSSVEFWESKDLLHWRYLSTFGPAPIEYEYWECPSFLPFNVNGTEIWVLIVSVYKGGPNVGGGTQYFVGTFDGKEYTNLNEPGTLLFVDNGPDFYCFKPWQNTPQDYYLGIASAINEDYEDYLPTYPWRGTYIFPRQLTIFPSDYAHYEISTYPIPQIFKLQRDVIFDVKPQTPYYFQKSYKSKQFYFVTEMIQQDNIVIRFYNQKYFLDIIIQKGGVILVDRSESGIFKKDNFDQIITAERDEGTASILVEVFFDSSLMEIFFDGGSTALTVQVFPDPPYDYVFIKSLQQRSIINYAKMYKVGSISETYTKHDLQSKSEKLVSEQIKDEQNEGEDDQQTNNADNNDDDDEE